MAVTAVFPATFDPVTRGHVSIAERSAAVFEHLVIGVYAHVGGEATAKQPLLGIDERVRLVHAATEHLANVEVRAFSGLAVDFARKEGARVIVRGLRVADDFEFERQMAMMNRHLAPEIETLLLIADPEHAFVSASLVREVALMGGDVQRLVPEAVVEALGRKALEGPGHGRTVFKERG
jgi:pantetheine-phosphate adenylyltransferase